MMDFLIMSGLVNGIIIGVLYSLIGCSLNILYGVLRVVNFAHGRVRHCRFIRQLRALCHP